jgi:hypothetical protein
VRTFGRESGEGDVGGKHNERRSRGTRSNEASATGSGNDDNEPVSTETMERNVAGLHVKIVHSRIKLD